MKGMETMEVFGTGLILGACSVSADSRTWTSFILEPYEEGKARDERSSHLFCSSLCFKYTVRTNGLFTNEDLYFLIFERAAILQST